MSVLFLDRVKKLVVYFGLYGSSLHFQGGEGDGKLSMSSKFSLLYLES